MECGICEFLCDIGENGTGMCGMYTNNGGMIKEKYPDKYLVTVPSEIESMPMLHYCPGGKFLEICTIGCNFRCTGCVSWVLTESVDSIKDALHGMRPEEVVAKAMDEGCSGIMFCFNEPAVSFFTFKKVASLAREKGLSVGCATNGYFTGEAFKELLTYIDFINIGIKGCTDETYSAFGAESASPVFRNLRLSVEAGVFTEVAAVYVRGYEKEVVRTAALVASVSKDIPFQVMRFIPLGGADIAEEPTIRAAEVLCEQLREILTYVYLFNSPGTRYLNTYCPQCGRMVVRRGFNGPMCAHTAHYERDGRCVCGLELPFAGDFREESGAQVLGYFGGYKTIHCLESIQTVLAFLKEKSPAVVASVLQEILKTGFIEGLYERTKEIPSYLDTIDHYAKLAGRIDEARELRNYAERYISLIRKSTEKAERPSVYFCLGHPLIAIFGDKFECNLVEAAGGRSVNKDIERDDSPGMTIAPTTLMALDPDIILITGAIDYPVGDFYDFCTMNGLNIRAARDRKVYSMYPYNTGGRPDWILGLAAMASIIHPEIFNFDMKDFADRFYRRFLGMEFHSASRGRSVTHSQARL